MCHVVYTDSFFPFSGIYWIEIGFVKTADKLFSISIQFQFLPIFSISLGKIRPEKLTFSLCFP